MTRKQYNSELEKTEKLEKIYGKDSNMIKNRLEWLATVSIEEEQENVDDMDFESLYKETYKIVTEDAAKITAEDVAFGALIVSDSILRIAEWFLTLAITFSPIILLIKLIF